MSYDKLKSGDKVYFDKENIPMELIHRSERYGVCVRPLDIEEDYDLIYFQVERGAYFTTQEAFEAIKSDPVYSLIDFKEERRAPSNLIFNPYDYWSKNDCIKAVDDLDNNIHELSTRHGIDLNINWERTLS